MIKLLSGALSCLMLLSMISCKQTSPLTTDTVEGEETAYMTEATTQFEEKNDLTIATEAYEKLNTLYTLIDIYGSDIYDAWYGGVYDVNTMSLAYLDEKTALSLEELQNGLAYYTCAILEEDYFAKTEEEKKVYRTEEWFSACWDAREKDVFIGIDLVYYAYEVSGINGLIQVALDDSKILIKSLSTDGEYTKTLKDLHTSLTTFYEFCKEPTGSFEQCKITLTDYRSQATQYINDLKFDLE